MCNVPGLTFWWYLYGGGVGGFGLSLLRWLGLVGSMARGPRGLFLPSFRGAPGVVRDGLLALAAAAGGISSPCQLVFCLATH